MGVLVNNFYLISIHSLRMEGDRSRYLTMPENKTFQSTPSAWRETFYNMYHVTT